LARSVELRRQQLEDDIAQFIKTKQEELRSHEQEVRLCAGSVIVAAFLGILQRTDLGLACSPVPLHGMRPTSRACTKHFYL
jgi:hypothetical protein